jgi:ABC-type multidrug transport system fused ATPase/permease subunit
MVSVDYYIAFMELEEVLAEKRELSMERQEASAEKRESSIERQKVPEEKRKAFMERQKVSAEKRESSIEKSKNVKAAQTVGIRFEHVTFTYPGQAEPVLRDVNFTLVPGSRTALVGQNGSGKADLRAVPTGFGQNPD